MEQIKNKNKKRENKPMRSSRPNFGRAPLTSRNPAVATISFDPAQGSIAPEQS
ncbi:hypothetical protein [Bradyrhizobium sp. LMG 9283]|uniref:hypothetical protein n=1 Tax=Bradyrhizobium sp. LMG 9283 TaxID=592064 RepID=UPI0038902802